MARRYEDMEQIMRMTEELQASLDRLNDDQRKAVDTMDGPLLVIAGPGTGKTQILSLRAANILIERDVPPTSILCLTYTDAGAEAMRKRLVELIGREGYDIEVATFHGFASSLRSRYPQFFSRPDSAKVVTEFRQRQIVNDILNTLDPSDALWSPTVDGVKNNLGDIVSFIDTFKKSGLTTDSFRAIQEQTLESIEYLTEHSHILELASVPLNKGKAEERQRHVIEFEEEVARAVSMAPRELKERLVPETGIYIPFLPWLDAFVSAYETIDEDGKTSGFTELRNTLFKKDKSKQFVFVDEDIAKRALSFCKVYEGYQKLLAQLGLYDFQDMISEAIEAMRSDPEFASLLQQRYQYIQVDEFQDTNGSQMTLVECLLEGADDPNIMVVGDDDQAIMRFQGATIACIEQFDERYHPKKVVLKTNYRSTTPIVELGKDVADQIESRLGDSATEKDIAAHREDREQEVFIHSRFPSQDIEYYAMAADIKRRIDEGFIEGCEDPDEAIAVIARKHYSLAALLPYLRHFDIPFSYRNTANVFQMEPMQFLLNAMRFTDALAAGNIDLAESYLPEMVSAPEVGLTDEEVVAFSFKARRAHGWMKALKETEDERLQELRESLISWAADARRAPIRELLFDMASRSRRLYKRIEDENPLAAAEFNGGIRAMLAFVQAEIDVAGPLGHAVHLSELMDVLDGLATFKVSIDVTLELGRPGAVRLTSAHSSKGLEFDLVYLLDSDDDTWHKGRTSLALLTRNMLIGDDEDDDDMRRLLFVAITRAKRFLEIYSGRGNIARELQELIATEELIVEHGDLSEIIETSWRESIDLSTPEMRELLSQHVPRGLSVTALNRFVDYQDGCVNSENFAQSNILKLPTPPALNMDFGTIVHAFLQDYVNSDDRSQAAVDELAARHRQDILWLDYDASELEPMARRFDRVVRAFLPAFDEILEGRTAIAERELTLMMDGEVPLYGKIDLMLVDEDAKNIELIDYKTGLSGRTSLSSASYQRQLQFYKLLVESHPDFRGYTVVRSSDVFVEPERGTEDQLQDPDVSDVTASDQGHLKELIKAVWRRILAADYDTSGFEASEAYEDAVSRNLTKDGKPRKNKDKKVFQPAYEQWLIENS